MLYTILSVHAVAIAEIKKQTCTRHCRISCFSDRLAEFLAIAVQQLDRRMQNPPLRQDIVDKFKIRQRRRAEDSTNSTEPDSLVLQYLRESFSLR
ncbi:transposase [Neisseria meningitidis]|nr:transposase [Neisseria meningitidis]